MTIALHQTQIGRMFFERDIPGIKKELEMIAEALHQANHLKRQELEIMERQLALAEQQHRMGQNLSLSQNLNEQDLIKKDKPD